MTSPQMILGMQLGNGYGSQPAAWRAPGVDPSNYTDFDAQVRYAQAAERGKFAFLFLPDFLALSGDPDGEELRVLAVMTAGLDPETADRRIRQRVRELLPDVAA